MSIKKVVIFVALALLTLPIFAQSAKYKCMLQMSNYQGHGAYIVISLIDPQGQYEHTLYVLGKDKKWYNTLKDWDKAQNKKKEDLSAITGASVSGGNRSTTTFTIDESILDKGYKIRFESAVEDQKYYTTDAEILLNTESLTEKVDGTGYIRFVKISKI